MAKGLDTLIDFLLAEIALCGVQGAGSAEFRQFIKKYFDEESNHQGAVSQNELPSASKDLGPAFYDRIWTWVTKHPDIRIIYRKETRQYSLAEFEAVEKHETESSADAITTIDAQQHSRSAEHAVQPSQSLSSFGQALRGRFGSVESDAHKSSSSITQHEFKSRNRQPSRVHPELVHTVPPNFDEPDSTTTTPRLYASQNRTWQALTGHDIDLRKVPSMEFMLLSIIASRGAAGITQPELVQISQQDKRSVPNRTNELARKGYISKEPVQANRARTSLCVHSKFAHERSFLTSAKVEDVYKKGTFVLAGFVHLLYATLKDAGIVPCREIRPRLGVPMSTWNKRATQGALIRLDQTGMLKRFKVRKKKQSDLWITCIRIVREPNEEDIKNLGFRQMRDDEDELREVVLDDDLDGDDLMKDIGANPSGNSTAREEHITTSRPNDEMDRTAPQWTPDRMLANIAYDVVSSRGATGIDSVQLRHQIVGYFFRRPMESLMIRITDDWARTQPSAVRHLAVVRDSHNTAEKKFVHYVFRNFKGFREAVRSGVAHWEGVSQTYRPSKHEQDEDAVHDNKIDPWGFPTVDSKEFVFGNGSASVSEARSAIVHPRIHGTHYDKKVREELGQERSPKSSTKPRKTSHIKPPPKPNLPKPVKEPKAPRVSFVTLEQRRVLGLKEVGRIPKHAEDQIIAHRQETGDVTSIPDRIVEKVRPPPQRPTPLLTMEERIAQGLPPRGRLGKAAENKIREERGLPQLGSKVKKKMKRVVTKEPVVLSTKQRLALGWKGHGRLPQDLIEGLRRERQQGIAIENSEVIASYMDFMRAKAHDDPETNSPIPAESLRTPEQTPSRVMSQDGEDVTPLDAVVSNEVVRDVSVQPPVKRKAGDDEPTSPIPKRLCNESVYPPTAPSQSCEAPITPAVSTPRPELLMSPTHKSADLPASEVSQDSVENRNAIQDVDSVQTSRLLLQPLSTSTPVETQNLTTASSALVVPSQRLKVRPNSVKPTLPRDTPFIAQQHKILLEQDQAHRLDGIYFDVRIKPQGRGRPRRSLIATFKLQALAQFAWFRERQEQECQPEVFDTAETISTDINLGRVIENSIAHENSTSEMPSPGAVPPKLSELTMNTAGPTARALASPGVESMTESSDRHHTSLVHKTRDTEVIPEATMQIPSTHSTVIVHANASNDESSTPEPSNLNDTPQLARGPVNDIQSNDCITESVAIQTEVPDEASPKSRGAEVLLGDRPATPGVVSMEVKPAEAETQVTDVNPSTAHAPLAGARSVAIMDKSNVENNLEAPVSNDQNPNLQKHHITGTKTGNNTVTERVPNSISEDRPPRPKPRERAKRATGDGSAMHIRREIIRQVIDMCGGVYPDQGEISRPFNTLWDRRLGNTTALKKPTNSTINDTMRAMCMDDKFGLKRMKFHINTKGSIAPVTKRLIVYKDFTQSSPEVLQMAYNIANKCLPASNQYFPEQIHHLIADSSLYVPPVEAPKKEGIVLLDTTLAQERWKKNAKVRAYRRKSKQKDDETGAGPSQDDLERGLFERVTLADGASIAKRTRLASLNDKPKRSRHCPKSTAKDTNKKSASTMGLNDDDSSSARHAPLQSENVLLNLDTTVRSPSATTNTSAMKASLESQSPADGSVKDVPGTKKRVRISEPSDRFARKKARASIAQQVAEEDTGITDDSEEYVPDSGWRMASASETELDSDDDEEDIQSSKIQHLSTKKKNRTYRARQQGRPGPLPTLIERLTGLTGDPNDPVYKPPSRLESRRQRHHRERVRSKEGLALRDRKYYESLDPIDALHKFLCTLVVVSSISEDMTKPDWNIVKKVYSSDHFFDLVKSQKTWAWMQIGMKAELVELTNNFQSAFLEAYEDGRVSAIEDPITHDWDSLVRWAMRQCVYPQLPLPVLNEALQHFRVEESTYELLNRSRWFRENIADRSRMLAQLQSSFITPLHRSKEICWSPEDKVLQARSWTRSNNATPDALYDGKKAHDKLVNIGESLLTRVVGDLVERRFLRMRKLKRLLPGRNFTFTQSYAKKFIRLFELSDFIAAIEIKKEMDTAFANTDPQRRIYSIPRDIRNGPSMAIMALLGDGQVKYAPQLPAITDQLRTPGPRLSTWGFCEGDYKHRAIDRDHLFWDVHVVPTSSYRFGSPLQRCATITAPQSAESGANWDLPTPPLPGKEDRDALVPIWSSFDGQHITWPWWYRILNLVLQPLVFHPGASPSDIYRHCPEQTIELFEIELVLGWLESVHAVTRTAGGGYMTQPGFWAAFGDKMKEQAQDEFGEHAKRNVKHHERQNWRGEVNQQHAALQIQSTSVIDSAEVDTGVKKPGEAQPNRAQQILQNPRRQYRVANQALDASGSRARGFDPLSPPAEETNVSVVSKTSMEMNQNVVLASGVPLATEQTAADEVMHDADVDADGEVDEMDIDAEGEIDDSMD